jgi:hypothetical protein
MRYELSDYKRGGIKPIGAEHQHGARIAGTTSL